MVKVIITKIKEFFSVNGKVQKDFEATKITTVDNKGNKKAIKKTKSKVKPKKITKKTKKK